MLTGPQDYTIEDTTEEWILYHNNFSLCSRKGAKYVCNSSLDSFMDDLVNALIETKSSIGFDAFLLHLLSLKILSFFKKIRLCMIIITKVLCLIFIFSLQKRKELLKYAKY